MEFDHHTYSRELSYEEKMADYDKMEAIFHFYTSEVNNLIYQAEIELYETNPTLH